MNMRSCNYLLNQSVFLQYIYLTKGLADYDDDDDDDDADRVQ